MSKHTKGPWIVEADVDDDDLVYVCSSHTICDCTVVCTMGSDHPDREANARLIAAAPDMLELLEYLEGRVSDPADALAIHGVIAKARCA